MRSFGIESARAIVARALGVEPHAVPLDRPLSTVGFGSLHAVMVARELEAELKRPVSPTLLFRHPSLTALARALAGTTAQSRTRARDRLGPSVGASVGIVGLACKLPGGEDERRFWELLDHGAQAISDVPSDRFDIEALYDPDPAARGRTHVKRGGFVPGVGAFDAGFFSISAREAIEMDPQQRLALSLSWRALENANLPPSRLAGQAVGVYVGAIWHDYADKHAGRLTQVEQHTVTGTANNLVANRISYAFDLRGPSLVIDSACSSSLVAAHLAARALRSGEIDWAIVGGVNAIIAAETWIGLSKFGGLAKDGTCKPFSANADGFGRGEGAAFFVMCRTRDAVRIGLTVRAVLRGSAANNDGATQGLTAPSQEAQESVIRAALDDAGLDPADVDAVEAHGTGTMLGDPIEVGALGAVYGRGRESALRIGSVKSNIGHLEGAAGVAGIAKTVLALEHGVLPPSLASEPPNPHIDFEAARVEVVKASSAFGENGRPARIGVSSFGWGGTNAHAIVEAVRFPPREALGTASEPNTLRGGAPQADRVAVYFSPQGSQWIGMGRDLVLTDPIAQATLGRFDAAFAEHAGWSIVERLLRDEPWRDVDSIQPALIALQLAMADAFEARGVRPRVTFGSSLGEICAFAYAGAITIDDAARVAFHYSRLQRTLADRGSMGVAEADAVRVQRAIDEDGADVVIAAENAPASTSIAGTSTDVARVVARLKADGVRAALIDVNVAAHSPQIDAIANELTRDVAGIRWRSPRMPIVSTLLGRVVRADDFDSGYWARNLREVVRLKGATEHVARLGCTTILEVAPSPVLDFALAGVLEAADASAWCVATLGVRGADLGPQLDRVADACRIREANDAPVACVVSAKTERALARSVATVADALESGTSLAAIAKTLGSGRDRHAHRVVFVGSDPAEIAHAMRGETAPAVTRIEAHHPIEAVRRIAVFPGQGGQWAKMGQGLLGTHRVFRDALAEVSAALAPETGWSLIERVERGDLGEGIDEIQPAVFGLQVAIARLWRSWGFVPDVVIGHSMGEVAAAAVARVIHLEDAARVIARRSRLMRSISGRGVMLAAELSAAEATSKLRDFPGLSLAVVNGEKAVVLAGDASEAEALEGELERAGVYCRRVRVDVASHSAQVDSILSPLALALEDCTFDAPSAHEGAPRFLSTVRCEVLAPGTLDAQYWIQNLRQPVRFYEALTLAHSEVAHASKTMVVEMNPHPLLAPVVERELGQSGAWTVVGSFRRDENEAEVLARSVAELVAAGDPMPAAPLFVDAQAAPLPGHPFDETDYEKPVHPNARGELTSHELVRHVEKFSVPASGGAPIRGIVATLGADEGSFVDGHRVAGREVVAGTVIADLALWLGRELLAKTVSVEALSFLDWLSVDDLRAGRVRATLTEDRASATCPFEVSVGEGSDWRVLARARVDGRAAQSVSSLGVSGNETPIDVDGFYRALAAIGLEYEGAHRGLVSGAVSSASGHARLASGSRWRGGSATHPGLVDSAVQLVLALRVERGAVGLVAFESIATVRLDSQASATTARARVRDDSNDPTGERVFADIVLSDDAGRVVGELAGVVLRVMPGDQSARGAVSSWSLSWVSSASLEPTRALSRVRVLGTGGRAPEALVRALASAAGASVSEASLDAPESERQADESAADVLLLGPSFQQPEDGERAVDHVMAQAGQLLDWLARKSVRSDEECGRVWCVTRGIVSGDASGVLDAPLRGMLEVARTERPNWDLRWIDLEASASLADCGRWLAEELTSRANERRVWRGSEGRRVARFVQCPRRDDATAAHVSRVSGARAAAHVLAPGDLDGVRFVARPADNKTVDESSVEVAVDRAGLNFLDVLTALGERDTERRRCLGVEVCGRVSRAPEGASLAVGQWVTGYCPGAFATHVDVDPRWLAPLEGDDIERHHRVAASVLAYATAYHALIERGNLQAGETILIHSAAGATGLAALHVARSVGARIMATASSEEKRRLLRELGAVCVADSRSLAFVDAVREQTGGRGVDVCLNSLAGEKMGESLALLAPGGRFLELGKRDIDDGTAVALRHLGSARSYMAVDLVTLAAAYPDRMHRLLEHVVRSLESGTYPTLPTTVRPATELGQVMRDMARGKHIGKFTIDFSRGVGDVIPGHAANLWHGGTHLITGGAGALGLEVAEHLARAGAQRLVLVGRRARPLSGDAEDRLRRVGELGAMVDYRQLDIADFGAVRALVESLDADSTPLVGIVHAAGVLDDAPLERQTHERWQVVARPKVLGAWNLHLATERADLRYFVAFSSIAAFVGTAGQANYAAANAFVDALMMQRRACGLVGQAIQWGAWGGVGLAAASDVRGGRLASQGIESFSVTEGLAALDDLVIGSRPVVCAASFDPAAWIDSHPALESDPAFSSFVAQHVGEAAAQCVDFARLAGDERLDQMLALVLDALGRVLRQAPEAISTDAPMTALGLDSLMSVELRNRLERAIDRGLSTTVVFQHPTAARLAAHLSSLFADRAPHEKSSTTEPALATPDVANASVAEIEAMSEADAHQALLKELGLEE